MRLSNTNYKFSCWNWTPRPNKNRSRSSIFEPNQDTPRIHPWFKFGPNAINICWVILFTSENCKFPCWNQPQISQGYPSLNLTKTLLEYIHGISLDLMRLIFVNLLSLQPKMSIFMLKSTPMTSKNRSRSSIFKLNQDTPRIRPLYKFRPNATNICQAIEFISKNGKFSCWNRPPWPRKIGQGHPSSNLTKTLLIYNVYYTSMV